MEKNELFVGPCEGVWSIFARAELTRELSYDENAL